MVNKPPEPEGVAGEQGLFMAMNHCLPVIFSTLIGPLLLLVTVHGSFHCKQE